MLTKFLLLAVFAHGVLSLDALRGSMQSYHLAVVPADPKQGADRVPEYINSRDRVVAGGTERGVFSISSQDSFTVVRNVSPTKTNKVFNYCGVNSASRFSCLYPESDMDTQLMGVSADGQFLTFNDVETWTLVRVTDGSFVVQVMEEGPFKIKIERLDSEPQSATAPLVTQRQILHQGGVNV
ncbi:MAG: hypothetical protein M1829_002234 [Trizodia sp. TS-e1964]|nr:MAG: hypothetical protein M1829_002234 [Trizodia sp. TS-e1964]